MAKSNGGWLSFLLVLHLFPFSSGRYVRDAQGSFHSWPAAFHSDPLAAASLAVSTPAQQGDGRKVWCIGKPAAQDMYLFRNIQYACGEGAVDCSAIQPGGACYTPNTMIAHASYAMNMFYQKNGRNWWTCHFNDTGLLVFTDPSFGKCIYTPQWTS
eukprot:c8884_g1_i1 orf=136-603(-)